VAAAHFYGDVKPYRTFPTGMNNQLVIERAIAAVIDSCFAIWAYVPLVEQSLNDEEVVVQAGRSAKVVNMSQKFVHQASLPFG
jgi:hypothetical protein